MRKMFLFLLIGFFLLSSVSAQQSVLSGLVVDDGTDEPLVGANVYTVPLHSSATTDEDGAFVLELKNAASNDSLKVEYLGYKPYSIPLFSFENRSTIRLTHETLEVQDSVLTVAERSEIAKQEIPHARELISAEMIELRGTSELSDVFKASPAVRIEGNDISGRKIQIRGSDASEVSVYVDGILINNLGLDQAADLSIIPTENIERIEVLKGANLTLLGSGAFGGVVNISRAKNLDKSFKLKAKQASFETQQLVTELNYPLGSRSAINYFGQVNGTHPGIEFFPGEALDSSKTLNDQIDIIKQNHNLSFNHYLENGRWSTYAWAYFLDYKKPSFTNTRQNILAASSLSGTFPVVGTLDFKVNYLYGLDRIERRRTETDDLFLTDLNSDLLHAKLTKTFQYKENEFHFLADYVHDELTTDKEQDVAGTRVSTYNAFLFENRLSLGAVAGFRNAIPGYDNIYWKGHFGLRTEMVPLMDPIQSPTVGIEVTVEQPQWNLSPYFNAGKNVKFLTLQENAFSSLLGAVDSDVDTLARFDPEISNAQELGISFEFKPTHTLFSRYSANLALFRSTVFNKFLTHPAEPFIVRSTTGRNTTMGIEASMGLKDVLSIVDLTAAMIVLDIEEPLLYAFKPQSAYSLQFDFIRERGPYLTSTLFYQGRSTGWDNTSISDEELVSSDEIILQTIDSFYDIDVTIGYRFSISGADLHLQASGNNLLDNSGYQFYLLNKRNYHVSLAVRI